MEKNRVGHHEIDLKFSNSKMEEALQLAYNTLAANPSSIFNSNECNQRIEAIRYAINNTIGNDVRKVVLSVTRKTLLADKMGKPHQEKPPRKVIQDLYLGPSATDLHFLKNIRDDPDFILPINCKKIYDEVHQNIESTVQYCDNTLQTLRSRDPSYRRFIVTPKNETAKKRYRADTIKRAQDNLNRMIFSQLDAIQEMLKSQEKPETVISLIEKNMFDFYATQTFVTFPRRIECTNELCNIIAFLYCSELVVPGDLLDRPSSDRLPYLLRIPLRNDGGNAKKFRLTETKIEENFTKAYQPIQICVLNYRIASLRMQQSKGEEMKKLGRKITEMGQECDHHLWQFLGILTSIRGEYLTDNNQGIVEQYDKIDSLRFYLNENLQHYCETLNRLNAMVMEQ